MHLLRNPLTSTALAIIAASSMTNAATITWTGSGNGVSLFETNNWDNPGGVISVSNFKGVPVPHDFVVNDAAATVGGTGGVDGNFNLGTTGSFTVTSGGFKMGAGAIISNGSATFANTAGSAQSQLQGRFDNLNAHSDWGTSLIGGLALTNGSVFNTSWFYSNSAITSSLDGASTLIIREDNNTTYGSNTVNFIDFDSKIVYNNTGRTVSEVAAEHLSNFQVNGEAAVLGTNISIFTDGDTGFTTVQAMAAVPEPATSGMLAIGLLGLGLKRRR